ncbi:stalk domain-containing protein [Paenibacillus sp. GCM10023250]|uniref:stalk domain-containing protein n=1 Tax=Paenibacillus sp. GCM10023250 TaxID=3252648 RepID=UPI00361B14C7
MNHRTHNRPVKTMTATVLGTALLLSAAAPFAFAAETGQSSAAPVAVVAQANGAIQMTTTVIKNSTNQLETDLEIPVLKGMKDAAYQNALNANIAARAKAAADAIAKQAAAGAGSDELRPYGVTVKAELISNGSAAADGVLSLRVLTYTYTGGAHGVTLAETYNVRNEAKASPIKLKDLFGANYKSIVNRAVQAEIKARPGDFFADQFRSIADDQAFYIKNGVAYVIFQQYEIAPYAAGMPEIAVVIPDGAAVPAGAVKLPVVANGQNVKAALYAAPGGTVMAPLRTVASALGYTISYDARTHQTKATKGNDWAKISAGLNRYAFKDMASFALGAAPATKNGTLYVPLDFFAKVLHADLAYTKQAIVLTSAPAN